MTDSRPATETPISATHVRNLAIALTNHFGDDRDARLQWVNARRDEGPDVDTMNSLTEYDYGVMIEQARALPKQEHDASPKPRLAAVTPTGAEVPPPSSQRTMDEPPVQEAIRRVMYDIGRVGVGKDSENREQHYSFRGIDDFVQKLSPLLAKHGVVILPGVSRHEMQDITTKTGTLNQQALLTVDWTIVGPAGDSLVATTVGQARDMADKASNKAMSAAFKYLLAQVFAVPNIGWEEADFDSPEGASNGPLPGPSAEEIGRESQERVDLWNRLTEGARLSGVPLGAFTQKFRDRNGGVSLAQLQGAPLSILRPYVEAVEAYIQGHPEEVRRGQDDANAEAQSQDPNS